MNIFICSRFLYPGILALIVSTISYPLGSGQFIAGELSTHEQVHQLFMNFTWTGEELTVEQATIVNHWSTKYTDVFFHLSAYLLFTVNILRVTQIPFQCFSNLEKLFTLLVYFLDRCLHNTGSVWNVHSSIQNR